MDEKEMKAFLDKTGLSIAYSHFPDNQKPPFLCFLSNKKAEGCDNKNNLYRYDYSIELYTEKKDITSEEKLEGLLNSAGISFSSETIWIDDADLFVTYYTISICLFLTLEFRCLYNFITSNLFYQFQRLV